MRMTVLASETPQSIIESLFKRSISTFIAIRGRRESGKTHLGFLLSEIIQASGIVKHFATNCRVLDSPFPIQFIDNLDDLRLWCETYSGKKLFIFDEFGKVFRRRTPMAKLNIEIMDDLQILRKHKLSIIAIFPSEKYVDSTTFGSDVLDVLITKPDNPNPKISQKIALYHDILRNYRRTFENIPETKVKFDTWDTAKFKRHGEIKKPAFKDSDLSLLWDWSHGAKAHDLNVKRMTINRLTRKFIKEVLERESNK